jgi:hypothetical protein
LETPVTHMITSNFSMLVFLFSLFSSNDPGIILFVWLSAIFVLSELTSTHRGDNMNSAGIELVRYCMLCLLHSDRVLRYSITASTPERHSCQALNLSCIHQLNDYELSTVFPSKTDVTGFRCSIMKIGFPCPSALAPIAGSSARWWEQWEITIIRIHAASEYSLWKSSDFWDMAGLTTSSSEIETLSGDANVTSGPEVSRMLHHLNSSPASLHLSPPPFRSDSETDSRTGRWLLQFNNTLGPGVIFLKSPNTTSVTALRTQMFDALVRIELTSTQWSQQHMRAVTRHRQILSRKIHRKIH